MGAEVSIVVAHFPDTNVVIDQFTNVYTRKIWNHLSACMVRLWCIQSNLNPTTGFWFQEE